MNPLQRISMLKTAVSNLEEAAEYWHRRYTQSEDIKISLTIFIIILFITFLYGLYFGGILG